MKGFTHQPGKVTRVIVLTLVALFCRLATADSEQVLIIKSNDNAFFNTTIQSLINHTEEQLKFSIVSLDNLRQQVRNYQPSLIITLGYQAALEKEKLAPDIPVIHSYITSIQLNDKCISNKCYKLLLDQPLSRYITFTQAILPTDKIALLNSSGNQLDGEQLKTISRKTRVQLEQRIIVKDENPVNVVRSLLKNNDALLSLPDPSVYNQQTLKGILLSSYRLGKPVISYSPAHVKSGALAAIYTNPEQIGTQLAKLVKTLIDSSKDSDHQLFFANDFEIAINHRVANSLNLELPDEEVIKQELQERLGQ